MKKIITSIFILLSFFIFTACSPVESYDILTTNFITYDAVRAVVGDDLTVGILTGVNQDYHSYEPTSKDLLTIKNAKVLVMLGFEYDTWLVDEDTLLSYLAEDAAYINLSELVEHETNHNHEHHDGEHFWTDPLTYLHTIDALTRELAVIYSEYSDLFFERGINYSLEILNINAEFRNYMYYFKNAKIYFVGHNALQGFSEQFDLEIIPLENSINPHNDPTSEDVSSFINKLKENNVKVVFTEEFVNQSYLNFIKQEIKDIKFLELHGYHRVTVEDFNQGITYIDLLERNINHIKEVYNFD